VCCDIADKTVNGLLLQYVELPSVLWYCWLRGRKCIWPVKIQGDGGGGHWLVRMEWHPAGWSLCLPLLIFPCTIKSRSSLLAPAHPGGLGKRAIKRLCVCVLQYDEEPSHWVCKPAYLVPVASQDKLGEFWQKGIWRKNGGMREVGHWLVRMNWSPAGLSMCLPMISTLAPQKKFSSGTGSPRWSRKKGRKTVVCVCYSMLRSISSSDHVVCVCCLFHVVIV